MNLRRKRTTVAIVGLLLLFPVYVLSQTQIKGHHLGENADDFLKAEPEIATKLKSCEDHEVHLSREQVASASEMRVMLLSATYAILSSAADKPDRFQLESLADQGKLINFDMPNGADNVECVRLIAALVNGGTKDFGKTTSASSPTWTFSGGKLIAMSLTLTGTSFADVEKDLSKRTGVAPVESHPRHQNGFGATWSDDEAIWLSKELHAVLRESNNPADLSLKLTVQTRERFDETQKKNAQAPSPLD